MKALIATILSILGGLIIAYNNWTKKKAAEDTPEQRAKNDKEKMAAAIASGDIAVVNAMFNDLRSGGYAYEGGDYPQPVDNQGESGGHDGVDSEQGVAK
jgi:membrane protein involved in colicin uptake